MRRIAKCTALATLPFLFLTDTGWDITCNILLAGILGAVGVFVWWLWLQL